MRLPCTNVVSVTLPFSLQSICDTCHVVIDGPNGHTLKPCMRIELAFYKLTWSVTRAKPGRDPNRYRDIRGTLKIN